MDVSTVRELAEKRANEDAAGNVIDAIEERATDGRVTADAFADWHRECRQSHRSAVEDLESVAAAFQDRLDALDPEEREANQVRSRMTEYEDEFAGLRSELDAVAGRLADAPRRPGSAAACYDAAAELRRCERAVNTVAHNLHHLEEEVEKFETWLHDPETRVEEFESELHGFEGYLDNTEELLDGLEAGGRGGVDPFDAWLAAHHLQRIMAVVFDELRTDLAALDAWLTRREGEYGDAVDALAEQLASLEERHVACSTRLDATESAIDDFEPRRAAVEDSIREFEAAVDDLEPPVDWGRVERLVSEQFDELGIELR